MKKKLDPYATLGVKKDASKDEIKRAHHKRVSKSHPDKGGNKEEFLAVQRSYEILSNDEQRKRYDETGDTSEPVSLRERCLTELARLAIHVVNEAADHKARDLVKMMKDTVHATLKMTKEQRETNRRQADKFHDAAKRFKVKAGTENPFEVMLTKQAQEFENGVRVCDEKIEMSKMCLELLDGCSYEFTVDEAMAMWGGMGFKVKDFPPMHFGPR